MNLILAFLAFNIIVIIHELGHFLAAKKFGIKVLEFSLFIGPKLISIKRGDTQYSLRLIPLLAYVKMEDEEEPPGSGRSFGSKPKYARALTAFAGPLFNLLLAILLITTVFSVQGYDTSVISRISEESPASQAGILPGDRIVSYGGKRIYFPTEFYQFLYVSKGAPAKVEYIRDEVKYVKNITPRIIPEAATPMLGVNLRNEGGKSSNVIEALLPDMPAMKVGLQPGDRIVELNDTKVETAEELIGYVGRNGLKPIDVKVLRGDSEVNVTITPVEVKTQEMYDAGILFSRENGGVFTSFKQSISFTYSISRNVVYSIGWLVTGQAKFNEMMGPIGMVSTIGTVVEQAPNIMEMILSLLYLTSLFSIALGATNLLPFPVFDGGRLVLIGIEAVRGKPLSQEKEAYISMVGFALIILLGIYVAYNDIVRLITGII